MAVNLIDGKLIVFGEIFNVEAKFFDNLGQFFHRLALSDRVERLADDDLLKILYVAFGRFGLLNVNGLGLQQVIRHEGLGFGQRSDILLEVQDLLNNIIILLYGKHLNSMY